MKFKKEVITNTDLIYKARDYAFEAHSLTDQKYGEYPFSIHPTTVVTHLISHGYSDKTLLASAFLHDVREDCPHISDSNIESEFGESILNNVIALTNLTNGEPNYDLLNKNSAALSIKIADTTCNINMGIVERSSKPIKYLKRYATYNEKMLLKEEHLSLWDSFENSIQFYKTLVLDRPVSLDRN